ncbi:MAG: FAD-dependent oxidoreductase, partial [Bacillota bacterium]|nr:FAD-dependent oxidoreductase [Bacillota bacterium]
TVWHYIKTFNLPTKTFIQVNNNAYIYLKKVRVRNDPAGLNVMRYIYPKYDLSSFEQKLSWQKLFYMGSDSHLLGATTKERSEILQVKPNYSIKTQIFSNSSNISMMEKASLSQDAISLVSNFSPLLSGNLYNSYIDYIEESYPASLSYLYEIPGGMVRLPLSFYSSLLNPCPVHEYKGIEAGHIGCFTMKAGCWVNGIHFNSSDKKVILEYNESNKKNSIYDYFDYVVCTIPFSALRTINIDPLFCNIKMRAIKEVNYTTAQKTLLLCKDRFWEKDGIIGGATYTDLPVSSLWYPSDHSVYLNNSPLNLNKLPYDKPGVMIGSYDFNLDAIRLTNLPEKRFHDEIKRQVEMVHGLPPGYLDNIVEEMKTVNWDQQPTFRGSLSFFTPQQKSIFSYGMAAPEYNERVFFAGEHISAVHRWIQGALHSGMVAANSLAIACKKHIYNI